MKNFRPPEMLFDEFWREGEVALLFGPARAGKSVLAMQVAESIARGQAIDGFALEAKRKKVLYVDMKLSERQFIGRYLNTGKQYKLSENLYRQKPPKDEKLIDWLRKMVTEDGIRVIVIDDISAVKTTCDGTRETLKLMRELRDLRDEFDLSILVIAGSQEQRRGELISEAHLMRSRILCDAADSVFAIGVHAGDKHYRYLTQTRTLMTAIKWQGNDMPVCSIQMSDDGFLKMAFDERFVADLDEETRQMICSIKWQRDAGASFRSIASSLDISASKVVRLLKKWTPALEAHTAKLNENTVDQNNDDKEDRDNGAAVENVEEGSLPQMNSDDADEEEYDRGFYPIDISNIPFVASLTRSPITDLKRGYDAARNEIFILNEQNDGKPVVWFKYDPKQRKFIRTVRDYAGTKSDHIDRSWIKSEDMHPLYSSIAGHDSV